MSSFLYDIVIFLVILAFIICGIFVIGASLPESDWYHSDVNFFLDFIQYKASWLLDFTH